MRLGFALLVFIATASCSSTVPLAEPSADPQHEPARAPAVELPTGVGRLSRLVLDDTNACVSVDDRRVLCWGHDFKGTGEGLTASATRVAHFVDLGQRDATLVDLDLAHDRVCAAFDDGWLRCLELTPGAEPSFEELPDGVVELALLGEQTRHFRVIDRELEPSFTLAEPIEPIEPILDFDLSLDRKGCALIEGGEVRCWSHVRNYMTPYTLGHVAGAVGITRGAQPCVWTEAGALWCTESLPGLPALEQSERFYRLVDAGVRSAAIVHRHLCAIGPDGEVWCAGSNHDAELGVGDSDEHVGRVAVELPGPAHEIAVSASSSCALVEQGVWCWGSHGPARSYREQDLPEANRVPLESRALFLFDDQSCAATPDEALHCWGDEFLLPGDFRGIVRASQPELILAARTPIDALTRKTLSSKGELFVGTVIGRDVAPEELVVKRVLRGVADSLAPNEGLEYYHCTINEKRKLECWDTGSWTPLSSVHWRAKVTGASVDEWEVCAASEGKVVCAWFEPEDDEPRGWVLVRNVDDAIAVAHEQRDTLHTCALTRASQVLCWPGQERANVFALEVDDAVEIVGGHFGLCVRNEAGAVRCGAVEPDSRSLELVLERGALELAAGRGHWCARMDEDGDGRSEAIACHGDNRKGQLGTLPGHVTLRPTAIELPSD